MKVGGLFSSIRTTLNGLSHQMKRLDVISENIANAGKTPDENGKVYQRKSVVSNTESDTRRTQFQNVLDVKMRRTNRNHLDSKSITGPLGPNVKSETTQIIQEPGFKLEYNPSHPKADENGFIKMPNVNPIEEMVDLVAASRTYDANVTVLNAAKQMAQKALEI